MDIKIARIFSAYGVGLQKQIFWDMFCKLKKTGRLDMYGTGDESRDYIYIDDVVEMLYALLDYDGDQEVFNLSSNEGVSLNQVINSLKALGYTPQVTYKESRSVDVPAVVLDNEKIRTVYTGPLTSFDDGLEKYTNYLRINGWPND